MGEDLSSADRFRVRFKLAYDDGESFNAGLVRDVSESGVFVETAIPPPMGTMVTLIPLDQAGAQLLEIKAKVVRLEVPRAEQPADSGGMGLEFVEVDDHRRVLLLAMLEKLEERASQVSGHVDPYLGKLVPDDIPTDPGFFPRAPLKAQAATTEPETQPHPTSEGLLDDEEPTLAVANFRPPPAPDAIETAPLRTQLAAPEPEPETETDPPQMVAPGIYGAELSAPKDSLNELSFAAPVEFTGDLEAPAALPPEPPEGPGDWARFGLSAPPPRFPPPIAPPQAEEPQAVAQQEGPPITEAIEQKVERQGLPFEDRVLVDEGEITPLLRTARTQDLVKMIPPARFDTGMKPLDAEDFEDPVSDSDLPQRQVSDMGF